MSADGERKLESCAEVAHRNGRKVGIITSITINHATPAGFYAHRKSRSELYRIGLDLISSNFEYFGGGGFAKKHNDTKDSEYQGDLFELAEKAGYTVCKGKEAFFALPAKVDKLLAVARDDGLPFAIDGQDDVPTLADYTRKGIEILDNPNGFFFMIEGGEIDHCGHANDAASNLYEVLALDDAVRVALAFYEQHKDETLVVITGDHETGGMTMGFAGTGYALYMERLANQKCSIAEFSKMMKKLHGNNAKLTFEEVKPLLTKYFNFAFEGDVKQNPMVVTAEELASLEKGFQERKLANAARLLISAKAGVGWTSGAHTALPVMTTSQGAGAELFTGFFENTDIAVKLKSLM
ncbi:MAG: alkaline phosphatase, partial [Victivallales bacterium]|nr:alkaline phosphatase [Victivallales bacterium]